MASTMATSTAKDHKKALRKQTQDRLSHLEENAVLTQSRRAQEIVLGMEQYRKASRIGIYLSMPNSEAQTDILIQDAFNHDKKVFVPYLYSVDDSTRKNGKRKVMDMLRLSSLNEYESLQRDSWGIPSLSAEGAHQRENAIDEGLEMIVVPGVAFDATGARLGHGAGFYDTFLTRYCADEKRKSPYLVGLCLTEQTLEPGRIAMQDHDWRVHAVAAGDASLHVVRTDRSQ